MRRRSVLMLATALAVSPAVAQDRPVPGADQAIGQRFEIKADALPKPYEAPGVSNAPLTVPREGRAPSVPEGFKAELFAELEHPRQMLVLPNGDVLVAEQRPGHITLLADRNGDGRAEYVQRFAGGFTQPYGLARRDGEILVADARGISTLRMTEGAVRPSQISPGRPAAQVPPEQRGPVAPMDHRLLTAAGVFGESLGHSTRSLAVSPADGRLFVGVGSAGNVGEEPEPRATIQSFAADGGDQKTVATGARNPIGLAFHPDTKRLWAIVQERDGLGDELVPDFLTEVKEGAHYGYPHAYIGPNPQPGFAQRAPDKVKATAVPDLLFQPHSAAMDFVFYTGEQFPEEYRGDAFVVLKGSWNRSTPTGYKIVRVPFENGRPSGGYDNFMSGFWVSGTKRAEVWGRPADIAMTRDGALLVSDDSAGTIWRISYAGAGTGQKRAEAGAPAR